MNFQITTKLDANFLIHLVNLKIPKSLIKNINDFIGYKGGELLIEPKYISEVINVEWDELDY